MAVSNRESLEAALRADFSRDHLAVYADALQEEGDPRGELIAIDLRIADYGLVDELTARRAQLLSTLLGATTAAHFIRYHKQPFQFGFGDVRIDSVGGAGLLAERALLTGSLGEYLRHVSIRGGEKHIRSGVGTLVRRTHLWLRTLHVHYSTTASRRTESIVSARQTWQLIEATPALESLKVTRSTTTAEAAARPVFPSFDHPSAKIV
jgi:uncharacterized protein (TIGR02996 family)